MCSGLEPNPYPRNFTLPFVDTTRRVYVEPPVSETGLTRGYADPVDAQIPILYNRVHAEPVQVTPHGVPCDDVHLLEYLGIDPSDPRPGVRALSPEAPHQLSDQNFYPHLPYDPFPIQDVEFVPAQFEPTEPSEFVFPQIKQVSSQPNLHSPQSPYSDSTPHYFPPSQDYFSQSQLICASQVQPWGALDTILQRTTFERTRERDDFQAQKAPAASPRPFLSKSWFAE